MYKGIIFIFLFFNFTGNSQSFNDSIVLLNGNVFRGKVVKIDNDLLRYNVNGKKGVDSLFLESYRVFSFIADNKETVLYKQDTLIGNFLTIEESRKYTFGAYDARQTFKPRTVFYSSIAIAYGASLFDTYLTINGAAKRDVSNFETGFFGNRPSIIPLALVFVLPISFSIPNVKAKDEYILQKQLKNDQFYYVGFNRTAKRKNTFAALKGTAIGVGLGFISYAIFKKNDY